LDMLPTTELDQRIDVIVTPTRTIETNPGG
jgi:5-formyltetrahydrofolate cyclo-ligase